ncbi:sugar ABC transporter permease [Xylanimonas protaetiae]|uniref:Sugar ABC transporter permease n=2 Tax=Xylanimonas protaetiae TaxID=2509457 RepID=A0A4P6F811_9MICO|nr:sugar ABC transporter permease [Xylanimonas protaetiae]
MAPFLLLYTVFTIWPVFQAMWVSLSKWSLTGSQGFVGLANYAKALDDKYFWAALGNTVKFTIITVPTMMVVAVLVALLANRASRVRAFARSAFYIPSVLTVSVISYISRFMASPHTGFINHFLHDIGLLPADVEPQWLLGPRLAWVTLAGTTVWWTIGFAMLLYLAALQEIPDDVYEAASIDGASKGRQLFSITLPLMSRTHWLVFLLQVIACFKVFGQVQLITGGGPAGSTTSLVLYIYQTGFGKDNLGYASAMSFALFLILLVFSLLQLRVQTRSEK